MNSELSFILISSFGAICQEVVHWFEIRNKLDEGETKKLIASKYYWLITIIMVIISGIGSWILFYDETPVKRSIPFILGAAFPVILKKLIQTFKRTDLGSTGLKKAYSFKDVTKKYFQ